MNGNRYPSVTVGGRQDKQIDFYILHHRHRVKMQIQINIFCCCFPFYSSDRCIANTMCVCVLCSVLTKCIYLLYSIFVDAFIVVLAVHHRAVSCSDRLQNDVPPLFADVIAKCPYSIHSSSSSTNMQRITHAEYSPAN